MLNKKTKISWDIITEEYSLSSYQETVSKINLLCDAGILYPVKNSGLNGRQPSLFNKYWKVISQDDYSFLQEKLISFHPHMNMQYYKSHPHIFLNDEVYLIKLSNWLWNNQKKPLLAVSENERSYEIFGEEKFLCKKGKTLIQHVQSSYFDFDYLNTYSTYVPLTYYKKDNKAPQNILFVENISPFSGVRKFLDEDKGGVFGISINSLVFGSGYAIENAINDFIFGIGKIFLHPKNHMYYWGDLDYEGIGIYLRTKEKCAPYFNLELFQIAYEKMIIKAKKYPIDDLEYTKDGQSEIDISEFLNNFSYESREYIKMVLKNRKYIPQEILNRNDYM